MKIEYIVPFVQACVNVIEQIAKSTPERGRLSARPKVYTSQQLSIVCEITGDVQGQVIYGMSLATAYKVAGSMLGRNVESFDQRTASAIAELGDRVTGDAVALLSKQGFACGVTPPTVVKGSNVRISSSDDPAIVVPMNVPEFGSLELSVSLKGSDDRAAA